MARLTSVKATLKTPLIDVEGTWEADEAQRSAAWELYVELVTRVSVVELKNNEGLLREALSSVYSLFQTTRGILKTYGPGIARPIKKGRVSFGYLAVAVLNLVVRPVLAEWHPLLQAHEATRASGQSPLEHEKAWKHYDALREKLDEMRASLLLFANMLGAVCEVPSLIVDRPSQRTKQ